MCDSNEFFFLKCVSFWKLPFLCVCYTDGWRVGGLLISTPEIILTTKIPLSDLVLLKPPDSAKTAGVCVLNNARLGLWIISTHLHLFSTMISLVYVER